MRTADANIVVWLVIIGFVALAKVWNSFQRDTDNDPDDAPPTAPKPPLVRSRPSTGPVQPAPRRVPAREIENLIKQRVQKRQASPASPPPRVERAPSPAPASVAPPAASAPTPVAVVSASPVSPWVETLRDKQNLRNVIISAEIIGPPKALG
jgi:hypothetical protein